MNTNTYDNLKSYQQEFVRMIANAWLASSPAVTLKADHGFNRSYLREIAINNGMKWAPAWIVKDKNRIKNRGTYMVPEVCDYILSVMPNESTSRDVTADSTEMEPAAV
jgi:uncharacterized heparinase superfamily protein